MILLCEHPVARGCESAQSRLRSSSRRPGAPAGCSRCERCPDTRWLVERFHRRVIQVRFPESWSSTFSGEKAVLAHRPGYFCLDNAFALIEGQPRLKSPREKGGPAPHRAALERISTSADAGEGGAFPQQPGTGAAGAESAAPGAAALAERVSLGTQPCATARSAGHANSGECVAEK